MQGCGVLSKKLKDGFECPSEAQVDNRGMLIDHPKFAHPDDCQKFYVCLNGVTPREQGCSDGTVYNEEQQRCDVPENVPGWYESFVIHHIIITSSYSYISANNYFY